MNSVGMAMAVSAEVFFIWTIDSADEIITYFCVIIVQ